MRGSFVAFVAIFLIYSLEMMGGAEGKPQPQPEPQPGPAPQPWGESYTTERIPWWKKRKTACGSWCMVPPFRNCRLNGEEVCI